MTIQYFLRDTARAVGFVTQTHEVALETATAAVGTLTATISQGVFERHFVFTTPANEPNSAAWPTGTFDVGVDINAIDSDLTITNLDFWRISADTNSQLEIEQQSVSWSTTGLHSTTTASKTWTAGNASDRLALGIGVNNTNAHMDEDITLDVNTSDTYVTGPWTAVTVVTKTATLNAVLKELGKTRTATLSARVQDNFTKTATFNAFAAINVLKTATLNGLVKIFGATRTATFNARLLTIGKTLTATLNGIVTAQVLKTATLNALVTVLGEQRTATLNAVLFQAGKTITSTLDARIQEAKTRSATLNAVLFVAGRVATATLNSVVLATNSVTVTFSGFLAAASVTFTKTATLSAAVQDTKSLTATLNLLVQELGVTETATLNAVVEELGKTLTATLDGQVQQRNIIRMATLNSILLALGKPLTATLNGIVSLIVTRSATLNAVVLEEGKVLQATLNAQVGAAVDGDEPLSIDANRVKAHNQQDHLHDI